MLTLLFNTYTNAFSCPGGGEIQLLKYAEVLKDMGHRVLFFDKWKPQYADVDIVHYFSVQGGSSIFCDHVKSAYGLPLVISPILWLGEDVSEYPLDEIQHLLLTADIALPNSTAECRQLSEYFDIPINKFTPVHNGVDPIFFSMVSPELFRYEFSLNEPFLLNMANIEPRKNQLTLIKALKNAGLQLILAGDIRDNMYYAKCMKEGEGFVRYLGKLEHGSELQRSAYTACDIFVLPSMLETPGLAALEAGACGAKLAVTEIGCTKEYFRNSCTYLNPNDSEQMLRAITEALKSDAENIEKRIRNKFTWMHAGIQLEAAYKTILNEKM